MIDKFSRLQREQIAVQYDKRQDRGLAAYHRAMLLESWFTEDGPSAISKFVQAQLDQDGPVGLPAIVASKADLSEEPVQIAELGAGFGIALRQLVNHPEVKGQAEATAVDVKDWPQGVSKYGNAEEALMRFAAEDYDILPQYHLADVTDVVLPQPPDLVISVEVVQYLKHPSAFLCNAYNQAEDNALLFFNAGHEWMREIRDTRRLGRNPKLPMLQLFGAMEDAEVDFALGHKRDQWCPDLAIAPEDSTVLTISKKPGTVFRPVAPLVAIDRSNGYLPGYTSTMYDLGAADGQWITVQSISA